MQALDAGTLALRGPCLIEASAGTGKTYTLAALYLRLVLEAGLEPAQILVVTFTKAATAELRTRIRARLRAARLALDGQGRPDHTLAAVLARHADHAPLRARLDTALLRMDEAAIYTIHGFCQRVLQEHAFESGMLFDLSFEGEDAAAGLQVMQDFWRLRFHGAGPDLAAFVAQHWRDPAALWAALRNFVARAAHARVVPVPAWKDLPAALADIAQRRQAAAALWHAPTQPVSALLRAHQGWNRTKYKKLEQWLDELESFFAGASGLAVPGCASKFMPEAIAAGMKKGYTAPEHAFFAAWETLCEAVARLPALVLHDALGYAAEALRTRRRAARRLAFDDLLIDLHAALLGSQGEALAHRVRTRYPVALIDEFQDTDGVQYEIFHRLYPSPTGVDGSGLFMIGDPKQAIYSFRGGDIFTYMQARAQAPAAAQFTLDCNWRSTGALVEAVNHLFSGAVAPFLFEPQITFHPVRAQGDADAAPLRVDGAVPAPLQVWQLEPAADAAPGRLINKGDAESAVVQAVAGEVARLLQAARAGQAHIGAQVLAAKDIAILVPAHHHARRVQSALRARGVRSVYTGRESVFGTEEAEELARVLYALANPGDEGVLRAALLTGMLGVDVNALAALGEDERAWEVWLTRFQAYHEQWQTRGFMPMFRALLREREVPARLLAAGGGERRLTNLLHLAELLQEAARGLPPAALLRWLEGQRAQAQGGEEQLLRLESDEGLVRIVTIHGSKGLEYPVVFLPFPWNGGHAPKAPFVFHDGDPPALYLDLEGRDACTVERAARESLAEAVRLLYVALTRAKYTCYLAWGPVKDAPASALSYLLYQDAQRADQTLAKSVQEMPPEAWWAPWQRMADQGHVALAPLPEPDVGGARFAASSRSLTARTFQGQVPRGWRIESYSGLVSRLDGPHGVPGDPAATPLGIHAFPRGAQAGTFLHAVLEGLDFQAPPEARAVEVKRALARFGYRAHWQATLEGLLTDVLNAPLDAHGLRLAAVPPAARRPEIEFYFPLAALRTERLDTCMRGAWQDPALPPLPALPGHGLEGMMRGFIDLVVEHQGRYYVIDYKSNYLGADIAAYDRAALAAAVAQHRYDAQYLLYTLALHRYLGQRIADYDYARHMGGVYYLFLRGMSAEAAPGQGVFAVLPPYHVIDALDALLRGDSA